MSGTMESRPRLDRARETVGRRPTVLVIYSFFPHYRRAIVEALADDPEFRFDFAGCASDPDREVRSAVLGPGVRFARTGALKFFHNCFWQTGIVRRSLLGDYDAFVFLGNPKWPATWIGAAIARLRGRRTVFWTHGHLTRPRGIYGIAKRLFFRIPHATAVYGSGAKRIAVELGDPARSIHVVHNSIEPQAATEARVMPGAAGVADARRRLLGRDDLPVVACVSRLTPQRGLDILLLASARLRADGVGHLVLLVGDGPERERLERLSAELGVDCRFLGERYEPSDIADALACASVTAAPGMVGLTAIQSLAHGVPVVTHGDADHQMPEWESVVPGCTGSLFRRGDPASLADALRPHLLAGSPSCERREACRRLVCRDWGTEFQRAALRRAIAGSDPLDPTLQFADLERTT